MYPSKNFLYVLPINPKQQIFSCLSYSLETLLCELHPTIEDNVIIYANATILGGNTVVGEGATVAGNTFVTESVPAGAKVSAMHPELNVRTCENCTRK